MGVSRLSGTELVPKAQGIHDSMDASPLFPAPVPPMADYQKSIDDLAAANAAVDANGGKAEHQAKRVAMKALKADTKALAAYVQNVSGGDADIILASSFEVVKRGSLYGELNPPTDLKSRFTTMAGRVSMQWKREEGTDLCHVFMSTTNSPYNWQLVGATTKSRFNMDNLESGVIYWFTVTAIGAAGETSKSEPLQARAS